MKGTAKRGFGSRKSLRQNSEKNTQKRNDKTEIKVSVLKEMVVALDTSTSYLVDGKYDSFLPEDIRELIEKYNNLSSDSLRDVSLRQIQCLLEI